MLKVQQNYKVGIYVRLSKDDERAGESVSIEKAAILILGSHISQADEPKHNSHILLLNAVHEPSLTNLDSLNQAIQQITRQLAKLRTCIHRLPWPDFRGEIVLGKAKCRSHTDV